MLKKGSCVKTKRGKGKIVRIDRTTYSIPMYIIDIATGKWKGKIILTESEIKKC